MDTTNRMCYIAVFLFSYCSGLNHEASAEDCNGMTSLLLARIRNMEKRMDIDLKIMKSELKREFTNGNRRNRGKNEIKQSSCTCRHYVELLTSNCAMSSF